MRGLLLSLVPLVVLVLALAGLAGQCSFSPGGPDTGAAVVHTVDARAELHRLARTARFPVRVPQLPPSWRSTSADLDRVGEAPNAPAAVRVGWVTQGGRYLRLSQSSASKADLVRHEVAGATAVADRVRVRDTDWVVYAAPNGEPVWVAEFGTVRLLITGSGQEPEMRSLATATLAAPVST